MHRLYIIFPSSSQRIKQFYFYLSLLLNKSNASPMYNSWHELAQEVHEQKISQYLSFTSNFISINIIILNYMKIGFASTHPLSFLFIAGIITLSSATFNVTISCQVCNMACGTSEYCYRVSGPGYNKETCPTTPCTNGYNESIGVSSCSSDYLGNTCSNSLCFTNYKDQGCSNIVTGDVTCPGYSTNLTCGTCATSMTCSNSCRNISKVNTNTPLTSVCLSSSCKVLSNILSGLIIDFYKCSLKDTLGNTCQCCYDLRNGTYTSFPNICVQKLNSTLLTSDSFKAYATNMISLNRFTSYGTYSSERFMMLGALILALFMIMNY